MLTSAQPPARVKRLSLTKGFRIPEAVWAPSRQCGEAIESRDGVFFGGWGEIVEWDRTAEIGN